MDNLYDFPKKRELFIAYILGTLIIPFFLFNILTIIFPGEDNKNLVNTLLNLIIYFGLFIIFMTLNYRFYLQQLKEYFKNFGLFFGIGVLGFFGFLVANIIVRVVLYYFKVPLRETENQQGIIDSLNSYVLFTFIFTVFFAPFIEEILFRGVLYNFFRKIRLKHPFNFIFAIGLSGLIFGSYHVMNAYLASFDTVELLLGIPYVIDGIILAFIYYKTKNIFVSMTTHFINNFLSIIFLLLASLLPPDPTATTSTIGELFKFLHLM